MAKSLLQKAKTFRGAARKRRSPRYGPQEQELAVAWFRGDITFGQAKVATGLTGSSLYSILAVGLREAVFNRHVSLVVRSKPKSPKARKQVGQSIQRARY